MRIVFILPTWLAIAATGCGANSGCIINGDNVKGHVLSSTAAPVRSNVNIIVEISQDTFATVANRAVINNAQGLISVPYTICANTGVDFKVRAYQDTNGNSAWDSGEPSGRDDGTSNGNATNFTIRNITTTQGWTVLSGVDVTLDSTTGL
ncbi:MAG: hypothetical protein ACXWP5_05015 [Bdellovibrionota bacterium]